MISFRGEIMRSLQDRGYRIAVLATRLDDFDLGILSERGIEFIDWDLRKSSLNPIADFQPLKKLFSVLWKRRPDLVFAHTIKPVIYAMVAAAVTGVERRVAMIPGLGYSFIGVTGLRHRLVALLARLGYRAALQNADMVIFHNSDDVVEMRAARALPASAVTGVVNGSGVDMEHFAPAPLPEGPPTFLFVARLLKDKGVCEFVEAARAVKAQHPEARFVLVGAADSNPTAISKEALQAWVSEGVVEAAGHVRDPRQAYADCHVFVLPSYREGTPRTNLEAMATGRALITTDVPGCRETVEPGYNGVLVPPRDAGALAEAMLSFLRNADQARVMGEASLSLCREKFELSKVARATVSLMLSDPPAPRPTAVAPEPALGMPGQIAAGHP